MIIGIGTDLIEIDRVKKACEKETFRYKIFTEKELKMAGSNYSRLAGNFAVKEAIVKMFGTGFRGISPIDIEVLRDDLGKPYVNLYNNAYEFSKEMGLIKIFVTITNTKKYASAFVIGEGCDMQWV